MDLGIPEVKFFPWVGSRYCRTGYRGKKLLILGESEYQRPGSNLEPELVSTLITDNKFRFYKKVYRSISDGVEEDSQMFWNSVAFYNYVQEAVGTAPRQRPSHEMWTNSAVPFRLVLNKLDPDRVLVLGCALWANLQSLGLIAVDSTLKDSFYLSTNHKRIKAVHIRHPSSWGFKPATWRSIAASLLT